ncbi:MAG TPA: hypothetical protein VKY86_00245 [Promicromonospora sp.]|nr:hypothetical protein [Promicromonospora sp.]
MSEPVEHEIAVLVATLPERFADRLHPEDLGRAREDHGAGE